MRRIQRVFQCLFILVILQAITACEWGSIGYNKGYQPDQPIAFSHKLHAGDYQISCVYCHTQVEVAKPYYVYELSPRGRNRQTSDPGFTEKVLRWRNRQLGQSAHAS